MNVYEKVADALIANQDEMIQTLKNIQNIDKNLIQTQKEEIENYKILVQSQKDFITILKGWIESKDRLISVLEKMNKYLKATKGW